MGHACQFCRGRFILISALTSPCNYCSVHQRPRSVTKIKRFPQGSELVQSIHSVEAFTNFISSSVLSAAARPRLSPCRRLLLSLAALVLLTKFSDPFLFFFRFNDSTQKKRDSRIGKGVSWPLGVHEGEGKYGIPSLSYGVKP